MYACKTIIMRQVVLCYKIGFREGVHTLRGLDGLGVPGFGVGLGVQGSTETFSDKRGRSWRIRGLRVASTIMAFGMKYLSRRSLGVRGEALGVLEEVLVVPGSVLSARRS